MITNAITSFFFSAVCNSGRRIYAAKPVRWTVQLRKPYESAAQGSTRPATPLGVRKDAAKAGEQPYSSQLHRLQVNLCDIPKDGKARQLLSVKAGRTQGRDATLL